MRTMLAALLLLFVTPLASAEPSWYADDEGVFQALADPAARVVRFANSRKLVATRDGGVWATSDARVLRLSSAGEIETDLDTRARGYGNPTMVAVDPDDGSAWIATDAALLLHIARDGALLQGTTVTRTIDELTVRLDGGPSALANGELLRYDRDGRLLDAHRLSEGRVATVAIDSLRDRYWFVDSHAVHVIESAASRSLPVSKHGADNLRAMALDVRSGELWIIVDSALVALDDRGHRRLAIDLPSFPPDDVVELQYDAGRDTIEARTATTRFRFDTGGQLVEQETVPPGGLVATPAPFWIEPTLAVARPPDGAATYDPLGEIVLHVGIACSSGLCAPPASYWNDFRVTASVNDVAMTEVGSEVAAGTVRLMPAAPMRVGANRVTAQAVDRFGHRTEVVALIHLLEPEPRPATAEPATHEALGDTPVTLKAANKLPTVTLISPSGGTTYTAGSSIALEATASDPDGTIAKVEFYRAGTTLLGTATTAPYRVTWPNAPAGSHSLTAKAYDNRNGTATSAAVSVVVVVNQSPNASLTSPTQGAFYAEGAAIQLAATANDPDGIVTKVEFFDKTVPIGAATSQPYVATWTGAASGAHSISARATDDKGGIRSSPAVDIVVGRAPIIVVTNPTPCSIVDGPVDLHLKADALSTASTILRVDFFDNGVQVGTATAAPWVVTLGNAAPGNHAITARAVDDRGQSATSRPSTVTVRTANRDPSVVIVTPVEGATLPFGSTVNLTATAIDPDGTVASVEYRLGSSGGTPVGRATSAPYAVSWRDMAAGAYTVVAIAYDDRDAAAVSSPIHLTINPNLLPTVALTAPSANAVYTAPATIAFAATASDGDGTIAKVEFYTGATLIGSATSAPFTATWSNVHDGSYSVTARATDNAGGIGTSPPLAFSVTSNAPPSVSVTAPASGSQYFAPATIALRANAMDSDGTIARVDFYVNGAIVGTATSAPYTTTWSSTAGGSYSITAVATDDRGAATTSAPVALSIQASAGLDLTPGLDGSSIADDVVLVSGAINAPQNSGVVVNGTVAQIDATGRFYANGVSLVGGANTVTITLSTPDGQVVTRIASVTSNGIEAFAVDAAPTDGLAPLVVAFRITNRGGVGFQRLEMDTNDDGHVELTATPAQFVDGALTVNVTYPAGQFMNRIRVYDENGAILYSATRAITVRTLQQHDALLRSVYTGMLDRLTAGDIAGALYAITGDMQDKYSAVFTAIGPNLPNAIQELGALYPNWYTDEHAEYVVVRDTLDGQQGFLIDFIRGRDGVWRIDGM